MQREVTQACCTLVVILNQCTTLEITTTATHALQMMADRSLFGRLRTYVVNRVNGREVTPEQLLALAKREAT